MFRDKILFVIFTVGILVRIVVAPVTAHPDVWAINFGVHHLPYFGIFNIYEYLASLGKDTPFAQLLGVNFWAYPYGTYLLLGGFMKILQPLYPSNFHQIISGSYDNFLSSQELFRTLFLLKLPMLLVDLVTAFTITQFFVNFKQKRLAAAFWLFNPWTIFITAVWGHFDILPTFCVVLSSLLAFKKKIKLGALALGLGVTFKTYPIFFLPIYVLIFGKNIREKIGLFLIGIIPYFAVVVPFLGSKAFLEIMLFTEQFQRSLSVFFTLDFGETFFLFLAVLFFLYFHVANFAQKNLNSLVNYYLVLLLGFYSLSVSNPQWFLWSIPFLTLRLVENFKEIWIQSLLYVAFFVVTAFYAVRPIFLIFAPISKIFLEFPDLSEASSPFIEQVRFRGIFRSLIASVALWYWYLILLKTKNETTGS